MVWTERLRWRKLHKLTLPSTFLKVRIAKYDYLLSLVATLPQKVNPRATNTQPEQPQLGPLLCQISTSFQSWPHVLFFSLLCWKLCQKVMYHHIQALPMQPAVQNKVFMPFSTWVMIATLKKNLTDWWTWIGRKAQGLLGSVLCSQSHLNLRAQFNCCSCEMPSPPSASGQVTLDQANKQCPPFISFIPFQRKPLLILSIALRA